MAIRFRNADALDASRRSMGSQRLREDPNGSPASPNTPHQWVRVYARLKGSPGGSPSKTLGVAIVLLAIIIALMIAFVR